MYRILLCVIALFCSACGFFWVYVRGMIPKQDCTLRTVFRLVLFSQIGSVILEVTNLLLGASADDWSFGGSLCVFLGFVTTVQSAVATWVLMIAALERYFRFLLPGDHPLTFSPRNIKLLVSGVYIFVSIIATGPLYGLGEYSHFRGYMSLSIKQNISADDIHLGSKNGSQLTSAEQTKVLLLIFNTIQSSPILLNSFMTELSQRYGIYINSKQPFLTNPEFIFRSTNATQIDDLQFDYDNGIIKEIMHKHLLNQDIKVVMETYHIQLFVDIDEFSVRNYKRISICSQSINHCAIVYDSPLVHASVWSLYQLVVNIVFPYGTMGLLYLLIVLHDPNSIHAGDKNMTEEDLTSLKILSFTSCYCFFTSLIYYTCALINANGVFISNDSNFLVTFINSSSGFIFILAFAIFDFTCTTRARHYFSCFQFLSKPKFFNNSLPDVTNVHYKISKGSVTLSKDLLIQRPI